ncbi:MAG: HAD family phosphatase [Candidatus Ancillula sp.]|jgi:epoxide hydrolase-like predicted phosphatase|nr:HAD family phosphatase [Candidatus Ancillula sp.]
MTQVKNVVFDIGNVLVVWDPYASISARYTKEEFEKFKTEVKFDELIELWDSGVLHHEIAMKIEDIDRKQGTHWADLYSYYVPRFAHSIQGFIPGMAQIIADLKARGINVYGLTNWAAEDIETAKRIIPGLKQMDGIVVSGIEQTKKPDAKIYEILLERYNLTPGESVFIDDREDNIETARNLGMHGFVQEAPLEQGAPRFREYLKSLGVDL